MSGQVRPTTSAMSSAMIDPDRSVLMMIAPSQ